jgi:hypothetical protein
MRRERSQVKFFHKGRAGAARKIGEGHRVARLSAEEVAELEAFGRFSDDPVNSPSCGDLEARMYWQYQRDTEVFLGALAIAAAEHGGWVAVGAERLMVSIAGGNLGHPAYDIAMAEALNFLRSQGVADSRLTGYEISWWRARHAPDEP